MKNYLCGAVVSIVISTVPICASAQGCDAILSLTRSVDYQASSTNIANSLFKSECSGSQLKAGWSVESGLDFAIDAIPMGLKLNAGSTKDKVEHLCKNFESWSVQNADTLRIAISTAIPAIQAWENCKRWESSGVDFTFNPVREVVALSVKRGTEVINFQGMTYEKSKIICEGPFGKNGQNVTIDPNTRFELVDDDVVPFVCNRILNTDASGNEFYPEVTITASAEGLPPLAVPLDRLDKSGGLFLNELEERLTQSISRIDALEVSSVSDKFNSLLSADGTITIQGNCFRPRTLNVCYYERPGEYDHFTWVENLEECRRAGFNLDHRSFVVLGQC